MRPVLSHDGLMANAAATAIIAIARLQNRCVGAVRAV